MREAIAKSTSLEDSLQRLARELGGEAQLSQQQEPSSQRPTKRLRRKGSLLSQEDSGELVTHLVSYYYTEAGGVRTRMQAAFPGLQRFPGPAVAFHVSLTWLLFCIAAVVVASRLDPEW